MNKKDKCFSRKDGIDNENIFITESQRKKKYNNAKDNSKDNDDLNILKQSMAGANHSSIDIKNNRLTKSQGFFDFSAVGVNVINTNRMGENKNMLENSSNLSQNSNFNFGIEQNKNQSGLFGLFGETKEGDNKNLFKNEDGQAQQGVLFSHTPE